MNKFNLTFFYVLIQSISCYGAVDSLSLDDLTQKALASYPSIMSRQATKDAATSDVTAAKLKFLPTPSVNTQTNSVDFDNSAKTQQTSTNLTLSQPIWAGGGLAANYNKANARLSATEFALYETREDVARKLVSAYAEWVKAHLKTQALNENVLVYQKLAELITRRYENGVSSGVDKDLGYSRLLQAQADLATQHVIEETALSTISELVGENVVSSQLVGNIASYVSLPQRAELIAKSVDRSVSVQRYKYEAEAAEQESLEINAQSLPQVSFQVQRQFGNAIYPGLSGFTALGLVVGYTPGAGFSSLAATASAKDRARAASLQVDSARRDLRERLNAEYNEYEFSLLKRENLKHSAKLSKSILDSYDRQYLVGRKSWLDLMNSLREVAQSNVALAETEGSILGASRRLMIYLSGVEGSTQLADDKRKHKNENDAEPSPYDFLNKHLERYKFWDKPSKSEPTALEQKLELELSRELELGAAPESMTESKQSLK